MENKIRKRKYSLCANCSTLLEASHVYCPHCGQANHDLNVPLKHLLEEAAEGILHFDIKSVRTVQTLAFKPGFLTSEFIKGKRVSYVPPVRLYIFISFLFFLVLSLLTGRHESVSSVDSPSTSLDITYDKISSRELRGIQPSQLDSIMESRGVPLSVLNRYIVRQLSRFGTEGQEGFYHLLAKGISYMMFALMPLFALFVYLLNRKKAQYYIGTLVFSVHYHCFVFLLLIVSLLLDRIIKTSLILIIPVLVCPIYLFMAMRYLYEGSRMKMIGKTLLVGVLQFVSMAFLFIITVFISLLLF